MNFVPVVFFLLAAFLILSAFGNPIITGVVRAWRWFKPSSSAATAVESVASAAGGLARWATAEAALTALWTLDLGDKALDLKDELAAIHVKLKAAKAKQ